jgi:glycosyltransferase involved in cell wall biosynthesis
MKKKILFGIGPKNHRILAFDEIEGFEKLNYSCRHINYGRNSDSISQFNRLLGVIFNAINIVFSLYQFSPDIIYLNSRFEPVGSVRDFITIRIIKISYYRKLSIVVKSHGSDLSVLESKSFLYKKMILPFLTKSVDAWFFLSKEEKKIIQEFNTDLGEKVFVTSNIIDPTRSIQSNNFKKSHGINDEKLNFLYVGRMVKVKGVFTVLKSIPTLYFKDNCNFIFIGEGKDLNDLKSLAEKLKISDKVQFKGFIFEKESDHFFANCDVFIYPTFDTEGFPMALFKAVAAGLPVITTQIRGAKDHLRYPNNVIWVNGESEISTSKAITEIYENEILRSQMSKNNMILGEKFSQKRICSEMNDVFLNL